MCPSYIRHVCYFSVSALLTMSKNVKRFFQRTRTDTHFKKHGYSAGIRSGDLLFVSGQVGSREDANPEPYFAR